MSVTLATERGLVHVVNPLAQARSYANELNGVLQADPALRQPPSHPYAGKSIIPYGIGVVLTNISRADFDANDLGDVLPSHKVICQDEMLETADSEAFQERLWAMFDATFACRLTLPQIDRFRHHLFPELRIVPQSAQAGLFSESPAAETAMKIPDLIRVMDLQQEQLARSLGDGHRVIHGVAGSGKTMILGYRCLHLARDLAKPVLVLCYNRTLAARLQSMVAQKGLADKVSVRNFHAWCYDMLRTYHVQKPSGSGEAFIDALVPAVMAGVEANAIPRAQYGAVLIDEGHDFQPEWFRLIVQMLDPSTNSLLVLYDDAQSIYGDEKRKKFSFKSVGIQAAGRTTILKVNYRNTDEILRFARDVAQSILKPTDSDEDGVPLLMPQSAGRAGLAPQVVNLPTLKEEAEFVVKRLKEAHRAGTAWRDMAVIYRDYHRDAKLIRKMLPAHGIPLLYFEDATYAVSEDKVTLITMHSCKGLEFPFVVIPGADRVKASEALSAHEAKLLYVAMTRATQELVVCGVAES